MEIMRWNVGRKLEKVVYCSVILDIIPLAFQ